MHKLTIALLISFSCGAAAENIFCSTDDPIHAALEPKLAQISNPERFSAICIDNDPGIRLSSPGLVTIGPEVSPGEITTALNSITHRTLAILTSSAPQLTIHCNLSETPDCNKAIAHLAQTYAANFSSGSAFNEIFISPALGLHPERPRALFIDANRSSRQTVSTLMAIDRQILNNLLARIKITTGLSYIGCAAISPPLCLEAAATLERIQPAAFTDIYLSDHSVLSQTKNSLTLNARLTEAAMRDLLTYFTEIKRSFSNIERNAERATGFDHINCDAANLSVAECRIATDKLEAAGPFPLGIQTFRSVHLSNYSSVISSTSPFVVIGTELSPEKMLTTLMKFNLNQIAASALENAARRATGLSSVRCDLTAIGLDDCRIGIAKIIQIYRRGFRGRGFTGILISDHTSLSSTVNSITVYAHSPVEDIKSSLDF